MQTLTFGSGAHGRHRAAVEKELATAMTVLVDATTVNWNCDNKKLLMAKLTSTQSFTIDMTNVMDGAQGVLKLITNTASAITLTFDTSFTNKSLNSTILTYTFPALTAQEYFLSFVVDGTTIEWVIGDIQTVADLSARISRVATQSQGTGSTTAITFDTETEVNANIWVVATPTRIKIPGSGNKKAVISGYVEFQANATGYRRVFAYKNGSSLSASDGCLASISQQGGDVPFCGFCFQVSCAGGDYIEIVPVQNSGSTLTVKCSVNVTIANR